MDGHASTVGRRGAAGASTVGREGAVGASTMGSEGLEDPGCLPNPPLRGGRGRGQPCGTTPPPACYCAGSVQAGPI